MVGAAHAQHTGMVQRPVDRHVTLHEATLPVHSVGNNLNRYGFIAWFEIRVSPGIVKTLNVRQFFNSAQHAIQGFARVQEAMPENSVLRGIEWVFPTPENGGLNE